MYSVTICNMTCLRFLSQTKNRSTISSSTRTISLNHNSLSLVTQRSCRRALVCHSCRPKKPLEMHNKHLAYHLVSRIHRVCKIVWLTMVSTVLSLLSLRGRQPAYGVPSAVPSLGVSLAPSLTPESPVNNFFTPFFWFIPILPPTARISGAFLSFPRSFWYAFLVTGR